jgi:uncharacterized protein involved in exopolysaccharide biosynthesis
VIANVNGVDVELTEEEVAEFKATQASLENRNAIIDAQIRTLEGTVTNRRLREAALTEAGKAWLADLDAQIAALRAQRV